jgi:hypothetical protein
MDATEGAASPAAPRRRIAEIFVLNGLPTYTFVLPAGLDDIKAKLDRPGRTLVIQGPSGSGKTTASRKALEGASGLEWLDARKPRDRARLAEIIASSQVPQHLVIDDFHRISNSREDVADLIRIVADERQSHITLIGINNVRNSLLSGNPDLAGCIDLIELKEQPAESIVELVRSGARAAEIEFENIEDIVIAARGNFAVAQQLCLTAAEDSHGPTRARARSLIA